ncbi:MAG: pyrroline-5-carboxylate reductase [Deltaproteobacteria bacterium]|nr:MAG: pyrroline-5-carboxylate reductase [Deltaproteobacteria bacterium]
MNTLPEIGMIGGGQMCEALVRGLLEAGTARREQLRIVEPDRERSLYLEKSYGLGIVQPEELCSLCQIVVVAVKPQMFVEVAAAYQPFLRNSHLVISLMAGVKLDVLVRHLGEGLRVIRAMPNTPSLVQAGATAISGNTFATADDLEIAARLFQAVGTCVQVPEHMMDAVTGLSGSGPGYVFTMIEAMVDGGVQAGLPRQMAEQLALQTVYGAAKLARESRESLATLRGQVTSPAGTTIAGLGVLERGGFRGMVMQAVETAAKRSAELGQ